MSKNTLTAHFISYPHRIEDLKKPYLGTQTKPYNIEKEVVLAKIDYENFITDLCVGGEYIEENCSLMKIDNEGMWHCIFVRQKNKKDGILLMSDGAVFPKWCAYQVDKESDSE